MRSLVNEIKELFAYKEMIKMLVIRDIRGRYQASVLGFIWTFINPLLQLVVYTIVFSIIMKSDIDKYYLFLFVGLIPWLGMANSLLASSTCVIQQSNLVTKIYFPRRVLPITAVTSCFVNMLLCMLVVIAVSFLSVGINVFVLLYLIPIILVEFILALGIGFIVSSLTVYLRDIEHILSIVVMSWQFLTPIMYPIDIVPEKLIKYFNLNPMTSIISSYRSILYYKETPNFYSLFSAFVISVFLLILGWIVFGKLEKGFAEEL